MKDWVDVADEFESMARRLRRLAEERGDEELLELAERLSHRAAAIRRDSHESIEVCDPWKTF